MFHTLIESVVLVALVILLFLQDWKALLLPVIDMAVSLVGTFAVMKLMGFSLNTLTLFGLVLAIGIVVDDAIVVHGQFVIGRQPVGHRPSSRQPRSTHT